ncbi:Crp/Fnr family transcriptional regulator [Agromyces sp. SYSU K20354]|uniref:Crp/Fnr family transcriptional regulator n=1 Tax=Agromyces cavernae TaxID=2898659 RepID=UPI001E3F6FAD|nr:Crp/Fnr family transcriptional regulator [Agromyces cavernae]MCD2441179.1 Crp/Fnr family transcriptional regulator [Agromyces cavernae]
MDPTGILLRTSIFRDLSVQDVEELLPHVHERSYSRGQVIWLEGDPADVLVVVAEGQLKAHRVSPDGREVILMVIPASGVTGEVGLFHPAGVRWLNLSAMTAARCLTIRRAPLLAFLGRHPSAMQRMLEQLSAAAVSAANSLSVMAFDDISHRVASLLAFLAEQHGEETPDGLLIAPRLSQGELAAHVAASRENVNRALAGLVAAGVVSQRDGHFFVHDRAALEASAQSARSVTHGTAVPPAQRDH